MDSSHICVGYGMFISPGCLLSGIEKCNILTARAVLRQHHLGCKTRYVGRKEISNKSRCVQLLHLQTRMDHKFTPAAMRAPRDQLGWFLGQRTECTGSVMQCNQSVMKQGDFSWPLQEPIGQDASDEVL